MKLNPAKCVFNISARKFLGFMVTQREIKVNPTQVKAILETPAPSSKKELQRLTGCLIVLGYFIACFTDKLQHFFLTLKGANTFGWIDECKQAFKVVKCYLTEPPILSSPKSNEELYMYLIVSDSTILFRHTRDRE